MSDLLTRCEVCQSLLDEEDLFCANCGTESPLHDKESSAGDDKPEGRVATHNFECNGCGASMSFDAREGKLRCPFCGSTKMNRREDARVMAPSRVVEFAISQDEAEQRMRAWLGRGFFRPGDLSRRAAVVKMTPVYVPYWVFEAKTHTYWTADSSHTPTMAKSQWYPVSGEHRGDYNGILVGASGALHASETAQICPFDLSAAKEPDQLDLDNVTIEQFAVPRKYARPIARGGVDQYETRACTALVPGNSRNVRVNVRVEALAGEPVLLPVWIMAYSYKQETYRFLVNGQTGKSTGKAPTSAMKVAGVAVAIIAAVLLALLLLMGFGGAARMNMKDCRPDRGPAFMVNNNPIVSNTPLSVFRYQFSGIRYQSSDTNFCKLWPRGTWESTQDIEVPSTDTSRRSAAQVQEPVLPNQKPKTKNSHLQKNAARLQH